MAAAQSPYPLGGPVTDPELLHSRRREIATALELVAPEPGAHQTHAALMGEQRSGRSSVLLEVARRAEAERKRRAVWLKPKGGNEWTRANLFKELLTALVESLASVQPAGDWYSAWRNRVYLRDRSVATEADLLNSSLAYAVDPGAELSRTLLERDLRVLRHLNSEAGLNGFVVVVDDASSLTEDVELIEEFVNTIDTVQGFGLLISGTSATAKHFMEAVSPCLARFRPVWIRPFRGTHQIYTALTAPLPSDSKSWVNSGNTAFLRDVLRLTGGNPYELMLVATALWASCNRGEQSEYKLTSRILDMVIPHLAVFASGGDALIDGARAIDQLDDQHVQRAVEIVSRARLSIRQIAIARVLRIDDRDSDRLDRSILTADLDEASARVREEVEALQDAGVVLLNPDGESFSVVGGRPASVLLKYKARARLGADVTSQPFELGFLAAVGRALARDAALRALEALPGSSSLAFSTVLSEAGSGKLSPRPAIRALSSTGDTRRLVAAEVDPIPWSLDEFTRLSGLLAEAEPAIALVYTALSDGSETLEYTEVWEVDRRLDQGDLGKAWSMVTEEWAPVVSASGLSWDGLEYAIVRGDVAQRAILVMNPHAATPAVMKLFMRWLETRDTQLFEHALSIATDAVNVMRELAHSGAELRGELSGMLSRLGFLRSFDDDRLDDARTSLEDAVRTGSADSWVTQWNLANVLARQGEIDEAIAQLEKVTFDPDQQFGLANVLFFLPGRATPDSLVGVSETGLPPLITLQQAVLQAINGSVDGLGESVEAALSCQDKDVVRAAKWTSEMILRILPT